AALGLKSAAARLVANPQRCVQAPHGQGPVIDLRPELPILVPGLRRAKPESAVLIDRAVERFAKLPGVGVPAQQKAEGCNAPAHADPHLVGLLGPTLSRAPERRSPIHRSKAATGEAAQIGAQNRRQRLLDALEGMGKREPKQKRVPRPGQLVREDRLGDWTTRRVEAIVRPSPEHLFEPCGGAVAEPRQSVRLALI